MRCPPPVVAARATAALAALAALAGCGGGPTARQVQQEHRAESTSTATTLDATLAGLDPVGELVGRSVVDECRTGQHNWKRDDPFDVLCTVEVRRAYLVTGTSFRTTAERVHAVMPGCPSGDTGGAVVLRDYWDELGGRKVPNFPGLYRPDFLPSYRLGCARPSSWQDPSFEVSGWATVPLADLARRPGEYDFGYPCDGGTTDNPCTRTGDDLAAVWARVGARTGWVVLVRGRSDYVQIG